MKTPSFWNVTKPTVGRLVSQALVRALFVTVFLSLAYPAIWILGALSAGEAVDVKRVLYRTATVAVGLYGASFVLCLVWLSRTLQDRVFTGLGAAATLFGLFMLVVFFWEIGKEVRHWFHWTPQLVERQNQHLRAVTEQVKNVKKMLAEKRQEILEQMEAELALTPADERAEVRKFYEEEVIPENLHVHELTIAELERTSQGNLRPDTSPAALLWHFLTNGPSHEPQDAGIYPALLGSLWVGIITILFAVPVGVGAALYLEEYKQNNWLGRIIQVNINNLAGVPSVVYGILGAFVFVELIFKPLEGPNIAARNLLGGGLTLGLLTLPVVIVSAQEAIRAVPSSIRQGAYALGATHWQVIWYNVLPMARPGIFTGTILSLSRALGEAAPLILFGALLFVNQDPTLFSRFTILPMQIFGWADRPAITVDGQAVEIWKYNAALASLLLLVMLLTLNGFAIFMRNRSQRRLRY